MKKSVKNRRLLYFILADVLIVLGIIILGNILPADVAEEGVQKFADDIRTPELEQLNEFNPALLETYNEGKENELLEKIEKLEDETSHYPVIKDILMEKSADIVKEVGIADAKEILRRYPHELSGGMRQRVMIAMALSCNPALLIADEPTTALDVTIQAQILDLMKELKTKFKTSILMITHDLGIIADVCDRVAVMYSGNIVEYATAEHLFKNPRHPYTQGLIAAIPSIEKRDSKLRVIRGMVPNLIYPPSGCRFHPRCDERLDICHKIKPLFDEIGDKYYVACHLYDPKYKDSPKYDWTKDEKEKVKEIRSLSGRWHGLTPDWINYIKMSKFSAEKLPEDVVIGCRKPSISFIYSNGRDFKGIYRFKVMSIDTMLNNMSSENQEPYFINYRN